MSIDSILLTESFADLFSSSLFLTLHDGNGTGVRYVRGIAKFGVFYYIARRRYDMEKGRREMHTNDETLRN